MPLAHYSWRTYHVPAFVANRRTYREHLTRFIIHLVLVVDCVYSHGQGTLHSPTQLKCNTIFQGHYMQCVGEPGGFNSQCDKTP